MSSTSTWAIQYPFGIVHPLLHHRTYAYRVRLYTFPAMIRVLAEACNRTG